MLRKTRLLGILVFFSFLLGCGGGSTTQGTGSSGLKSGFDIGPYEGNWSGPITGPNVYGFAKFSFSIDESGGVLDLRPDPQCPKGLSGKFINSNPFTWAIQFECYTAGIGVCTVTETGTLHLSGGTRIIGEYTQTRSCGVTFKGDFSLLKRRGGFQL